MKHDTAVPTPGMQVGLHKEPQAILMPQEAGMGPMTCAMPCFSNVVQSINMEFGVLN
jgi:hypothetical protein